MKLLTAIILLVLTVLFVLGWMIRRDWKRQDRINDCHDKKRNEYYNQLNKIKHGNAHP
jgi:preprotein translocase subunit YajC